MVRQGERLDEIADGGDGVKELLGLAESTYGGDALAFLETLYGSADHLKAGVRAKPEDGVGFGLVRSRFAIRTGGQAVPVGWIWLLEEDRDVLL